MNKLFFGLCGAGGFAREVMPFVGHCTSEFARKKFGLGADVCFVETNPKKSEVNGRRVLSELEFFQVESKARFFNIAIGDSRVRQAIADRFLKNSICPFTLISPNALCVKRMI